MLHKIKNHKATKITGMILSWKLKILLFILMPAAIFTLLTSQTDIVQGIKSYVVLSGSMEPSIPVGSIIYTQAQSVYGPGDVISFTNEAGLTVTHRIVDETTQNNAVVYTTKGDANDTNDQEFVPVSSIIGKVTFSVPYVGRVINWLRTPAGFAVLIVLPVALFILGELWNIKREIEKEVEKRLLQKMQSAE